MKKNKIMEPIEIISNAYSSILNPIIKAVTVDPILAPMITPTAWRRDNIPALTRPTVITVMAVLLCTNPVTMNPAKTPM